MTYHNVLALSAELHRMAVNANAHANEEYAYWIGSNRKAEDDAWSECQRTALLAELALDCVEEVEEVVAMRRVAA